MKKIIFILAMLFAPNLFAATLTANTVPYVCQGGTSPQLCNSNMTTDSNGNIVSGPLFIPNNIQVFTSSGTWTKPSGVSRVYVKVIGAGGSGGTTGSRSGGGGGGGGYAEGVISVTGNITVTIGSTNSFAGATTISATAGGNASGPYGGGGGSGSGGSINLPGGSGYPGSGGGNPAGGIGGGTPMGQGGPGGESGGGSNGGAFGGGGGGGGSNGGAGGGSGDVGAVIVYY